MSITKLQELEQQLGDSVSVLRDTLDLHVRQGDKGVIQALTDITKAWNTVAVLLATEQRAKRDKLHFSAVCDGGSVVDALFHYATEMFPNALACKGK